MNDTGLDNQLLELTYDELDDVAAERLRQRLETDDEAAERYEAMAQTRQVFALLDDAEDTISARTRADILREARLTAAAVREARERPLIAWRALFVGVATVALVALGIWLATRPPGSTAPGDDAADTETARVVASGAEATDEPEVTLAELDDTQPTEPEPEPSPEPASESAERAHDAPAGDESPNDLVAANEPAPEAEVAAPKPATSAEKTVANAPPAKAMRDRKADAPTVVAEPSEEEAREAHTEAKTSPLELQQQTRADAVADALNAEEPDYPARIVQGRNAGASAGSSAGSAPSLGELNSDMEQRVAAPSASNMMETLPGDAVDQAHLAFQESRYADAVALVTAALDAGDAVDATRAHFVRGMAHKKLGDNLSAIDDLRIVVEDAGFARVDEAHFALATSLEAIGDINVARTHYDLLVAHESSFADQARERLAELDTKGGGGLGADTAPARDSKDDAKRSRRKASEKTKKKKRSEPAPSKKKGDESSYDSLKSFE